MVTELSIVHIQDLRKDTISSVNIYRTYAGTLYIVYYQNEIVNTIISFFLGMDITFDVYSNKVTKSGLT
jgi:hypothetical protein